MSHDHLHGRSRITCTRPGFEGIETGQTVPLRTVLVERATGGKNGGTETRCLRRERIIEITAPDGTLHQFHARPEDHLIESERDRQPVANPYRPRPLPPAVRHHPVALFVHHFQHSATAGLEKQDSGQDATLELIEAILAASGSDAPSA